MCRWIGIAVLIMASIAMDISFGPVPILAVSQVETGRSGPPTTSCWSVCVYSQHTQLHMDTGHLSELDADGCSYGRIQSRFVLRIHNLYSSAQNNGLDDFISQSVQHEGKIMLSHCLYIRLFFKHHSPHDDGQSYRLLYCFNFLLFNITVYICDLKLR